MLCHMYIFILQVMSFINLGIGLWIGLMTVTLSPVFRIPEHQNMIASDSLSQIESATILAFCCSIGLIAVAAMGYSTATCVRDVKGCFYGVRINYYFLNHMKFN